MVDGGEQGVSVSDAAERLPLILLSRNMSLGDGNVTAIAA